MFVQIHPLFLHISRIRSSPTAHNYNDEQKDQDQCPESGSTDNDGQLPRHHSLRTVSTLVSEELLLRTPYKRNRICLNMLLPIFCLICLNMLLPIFLFVLFTTISALRRMCFAIKKLKKREKAKQIISAQINYLHFFSMVILYLQSLTDSIYI